MRRGGDSGRAGGDDSSTVLLRKWELKGSLKLNISRDVCVRERNLSVFKLKGERETATGKAMKGR